MLARLPFLASAVIFPVLFFLHSRRVDDLKARLQPNAKLKLHQRIFSLWTALAVLLALAVAVFLPPSLGMSPAIPALVFISTDKYSEELQAIPGVSATDRVTLLRVHRNAQDMFERGHFREAESRLRELLKGEDLIGQFPRIDSYVVLNNLGVVSFRLQRNRNFEASYDLQRAWRVATVPSALAAVIEANLRALDEAVNRYD